MITEWLLNAGVVIADFFMGFLPQWDDGGVIVTASNWVGSIMKSAAALGAWFPWPVFAICAGLVSSWYFGLFFVRVLRWVWGLLPFSGGS